MNENSRILQTLHRIHLQLTDLREQLDRGPKQVQARKANVARLEGEVNKAKGDVKAAKAAADQKQLLLRTNENKMKELREKLNAAQSNREYQALKDQIAADQMAASVLADEILEFLEKIDELSKAVPESEERLAKAKEEYQKADTIVRERESVLTSEIKRLEVELKATEAKLPPEVMDLYSRVVKSKGSDTLAVLDGNNCSGCYQVITINNRNALLTGKIVYCHCCGRMLYLREDDSPGRPE